MKVGVISHSPTWTTGFGVTCNKIVFAMLNRNYNVACFSVGETDKPFKQSEYPVKIWTIADAVEGLNILSKLTNAFSIFLNTEEPDALLINYEITTVVQAIKICKELGCNKKLFAHMVIDSFPVTQTELDALNLLDGIIVPTNTTMNYLKLNGIKNVWYAPHGVDRNEFKPISVNKDILKSQINSEAFDDPYLIGVFANNEERKQIPKVLSSLHYLIHKKKQRNIYMYLHTQVNPAYNRGWDMKFIIKHLDLEKYVILPNSEFKQDNGIPRTPFNSNHFEEMSYVERINMCNLIVNVPFCGGFELANIEAQSCGVPLITINDDANIKEVVNDSAITIDPKMKTIWRNGSFIYLVDEVALGDIILKVKSDIFLQKNIIEKGIKNARKFSWDILSETLNLMLNN